MVYIYKTSHLLQHNSRKAPNTQFKVDKLRQNTNCTENGSTTQKAILTRITIIPKMLKLPRQEIKNQLVKLRKQHNYVKPAISEYQGNCEGLVDSQPGLNKATQSYVYSRPRLTSERPRGQSVLAHYNRYLNVEVFTVVAWLTD